MKNIRNIAEFHSSQFTPILPEESQVNPNVYGAELAYWLCTELARRGIVTSYPEYEDWGWFVDYVSPNDSEFAVICTNIEGEKTQWALALRNYGGSIFARKKPSYIEADNLITGIHDLIYSTDSIHGIVWGWSAADD